MCIDWEGEGEGRGGGEKEREREYVSEFTFPYQLTMGCLTNKPQLHQRS